LRIEDSLQLAAGSFNIRAHADPSRFKASLATRFKQAENKISFTKDDHQGSQTVYPIIIKGERLFPIDDWTVARHRR
jgi:hypothetical protein